MTRRTRKKLAPEGADIVSPHGTENDRYGGDLDGIRKIVGQPDVRGRR